MRGLTIYDKPPPPLVRKATVLDENLKTYRSNLRNSTVFALTEAQVSDQPDVAKSLGVQTSELIDRLYDDNISFRGSALGYLRKSKRMMKFATTEGPPVDALNTLRLAEIDQKNQKPKIKTLDLDQKLSRRQISKDNEDEKYHFPQPLEDPKDKNEYKHLFISLVNQSQNPYLEYKKSDNIRRALLKRKFIKLPKTKNQLLAQKIVRRINEGKIKNLLNPDTSVSSIEEEEDEEEVKKLSKIKGDAHHQHFQEVHAHPHVHQHAHQDSFFSGAPEEDSLQSSSIVDEVDEQQFKIQQSNLPTIHHHVQSTVVQGHGQPDVSIEDSVLSMPSFMIKQHKKKENQNKYLPSHSQNQTRNKIFSGGSNTSRTFNSINTHIDKLTADFINKSLQVRGVFHQNALSERQNRNIRTEAQSRKFKQVQQLNKNSVDRQSVFDISSILSSSRSKMKRVQPLENNKQNMSESSMPKVQVQQLIKDIEVMTFSKTRETETDKLKRKYAEDQLEEQIKIQQALSFTNHLEDLKEKAPKVLKFMFDSDLKTLREETETQADVMVTHEHQKKDMQYNTMLERRQRDKMVKMRLKYLSLA